MPRFALTVILLSLSNVFMTFAWYAHLKELSQRPWWIAAWRRIFPWIGRSFTERSGKEPPASPLVRP